MPCVISSPSTDSGKTTLSLLLSCWAFSKGIKIQTFKVGPDYLDQQQLSSIGQLKKEKSRKKKSIMKHEKKKIK
jgi:cobyrinic acid a,c-diamide synthase